MKGSLRNVVTKYVHLSSHVFSHIFNHSFYGFLLELFIEEKFENSDRSMTQNSLVLFN
jgi:hypothetical protein